MWNLEEFGVTNALRIISRHQNFQITPQYVFQSLSDHLRNDDDRSEIETRIKLLTKRFGGK